VCAGVIEVEEGAALVCAGVIEVGEGTAQYSPCRTLRHKQGQMFLLVKDARNVPKYTRQLKVEILDCNKEGLDEHTHVHN